jgi:hypothetical protein
MTERLVLIAIFPELPERALAETSDTFYLENDAPPAKKGVGVQRVFHYTGSRVNGVFHKYKEFVSKWFSRLIPKQNFLANWRMMIWIFFNNLTRKAVRCYV